MVDKLQKVARVFTFALALTAVVHCGSGNENKSAGGSQYGHLFNPPSGPVTPNSIFGTWSVQSKIPDGTADARIRFEKDKVTVVNRCSFDDGSPSLMVGAEARAVIDATTIRVLESKEDIINKDSHRCYVTIQATTRAYTIRGTTLTQDGVTATKISD